MPEWIDLYSRQLDDPGQVGLAEMLEAGRRWDLAPVLTGGGVVVLPHAAPRDCGHEIAATVHACLDSRANKVLVIGVLHGRTPETTHVRERMAIHGPGISP